MGGVQEKGHTIIAELCLIIRGGDGHILWLNLLLVYFDSFD